MNKIILYVFLILTAWACNNEVTQQLEPKGVALGKMNEIVVICDQDIWEGAVGDTFRFYFESAYPILPAPEPLFDLRHFTLEQLAGQPLRKELRTYVILTDLSDETSETTAMVKRDMGPEKFNQALTTGSPFSSVGKDKWARGQILIYLFQPNQEALKSAITKSFPATARRVNQHDEKQLKASIYVDRINLGLSKLINTKYNLDIKIPGDYVEAYRNDDENVIWLRKDFDEGIMNLVIRKYPYKDQSQFSKSNMIKLRNDFGKKYITSDLEGDFMVVNTEDLPIYEYGIEIDGNYAKEIRGGWEMTEDFSGGPFITYLILNEEKKEFIYVDAFVLAPGNRKRNMMMQLDHIVKSSSVTSGEPIN